MEHRARRRLTIAVLAWALASCGAKAPARSRIVAPPKDAGMVDGPDSCGAYRVALEPSLGRLGAAADTFNDAFATSQPEMRARAARELAIRIDSEVRHLSTLRNGQAAIDRAHQELTASLASLSRSLESFANALIARESGAYEAALTTLAASFTGWQQAVTRVEAVCRF